MTLNSGITILNRGRFRNDWQHETVVGSQKSRFFLLKHERHENLICSSLLQLTHFILE